MNILVKKLESTLGAGTADLEMRFGIHSGPIVAGVLRGEKVSHSEKIAVKLLQHTVLSHIHRCLLYLPLL